jgi:4-amino-4-deoxy-L-arabinose transferase-like glycosyltransferase
VKGRTPAVLRAAYVLIAVLAVARVAYIASGALPLAGDEAYYWLWSKHPAPAYYSKPPLIAFAILLGTTALGDTELGVRVLAPVLHALGVLLATRFLASAVNARAAFACAVAAQVVPLHAIWAIVMTIDGLSVLFWTAALVAGWRAMRDDSTRWWLAGGLCMGLGFLSKYTALFQWLCWAVYFAVTPPARRHLRRPGPWLALAVNAACAIPVLVWNAQHGWVTVGHLAERGHLTARWRPGFRFLLEFVHAEFWLLHPIFAVAIVWASIALWRRRDPVAVYCSCMGVPLVLAYLAYTLRAPVLGNWIAPAVLPLLMATAIHWEARDRAGVRAPRLWLLLAVALAVPLMLVAHDAGPAGRLLGRRPATLDPLVRLRPGPGLAEIASRERARLAAEGRPAFIVASTYGTASLISFYLPEARAAVAGDPLVHTVRGDVPHDQFFFWRGYEGRRGQDAIFVEAEGETPPRRLVAQFASVRDLGLRDVLFRGEVVRRVRLFECRGLR